MVDTGQVVTVSPLDYDAVLFDLDGVLTNTAGAHAAAWKRLFDEFLADRAAAGGEPFEPFDIELDYARHVDGKPRLEGVAAFLAARDIELPWGTPDDPPGARTVHGLAKRKDAYFLHHLEAHGVQRYQAAVTLVETFRAHDLKTAVVSSSRNCATVLAAAGIADLFDTRVDGLDLDRSDLAGKPAPDMFLVAAQRLDVEPARAIVIEDALAGVAAGRAGGFGLVIGLDHGGRAHALHEAGADVVVASLAEVRVATEPPSAWSLVYEGFDPAWEGVRETLCSLGNGYFTTRGALPWSSADGVHYPGTYLAGGYNRLRTEVAGRTVENEGLVNFPNWLVLRFRIDGADWLESAEVTIVSYEQSLDLRRAVLERTIRLEDRAGRRLTFAERRFVSMADPHVAGIECTLTAENATLSLHVHSGIDGRVINDGAKLYRKFNKKHLQSVERGRIGDDAIGLLVRTSQSRLYMAQAARTRLYVDGRPVEPELRLLEEDEYIAQEFDVELKPGEPLVVEKLVALHSSRDRAISEPWIASCKTLARCGRFDAMLARHALAWKHLWGRFDVHLVPANGWFELNMPMLLRLNILHLLQCVSPNSIGLDIGVPARAWTGEHYEGHIFWDELFIFPTLNYRMPEITRSLLMYRYRRLDEARSAARNAGFRGAMFPWQSGSDGQEQTQQMNLNPYSGRWVPDNSYLQRHVGLAIAYNVWQYYQVTGDAEFLEFYGAELILEIARFWASIATWNEERGRYEIVGVMGPDEFHEAYPDAAEPGLANNAYTNVMAVWVLWRALDVLDLLPAIRRAELVTRLDLSREEIARWDDVSRKMFVPFHDDGIISQFEGYERLKELDWDLYRLRYGNIGRMELILESENDSANRYKVSKQADVLMLFYVFSSLELSEIFARIGYTLEPGMILRNVDYYDRRSSHGSTLSRVVHAWVLARSDRPRAMRYFAEALQSDVKDIQQGTSNEGVHLGAMAGTVDLMLRVSTGIEITGDVLRFHPRLPDALARLDMRIRYRGHTLDLKLTPDAFMIRAHKSDAALIRVQV
ncbi:MAG TPA: beta-phosphoglucomutase family hydrolase, partial [Zeimonas sp.]|nr:beta-phosphoglucomutase family hydrolase [Zeimonas sp.]